MKNKIKVGLLASALLASSLGASVNLGTVTVYSATKSDQSIKDVTSDLQVITGEELEERHVTTVLDALRLSGVSIAQSGSLGQTSSIFMNGMSSGNVLVMIDGIKYNDPTGTEGQAQLEHLMISDIEQIEIINGSQSGIWGANAVSGVINIITKEASKELQVKTSIEYGTNNTKKVTASSSQKIDDLSYYIGMNYLTTDGISTVVPSGDNPSQYEDDQYKNKSINAKIDYKVSNKDTIKFNITDIDAEAEYDQRAVPNSTGYKVSQNNRLYKLLIQHNFNNKNYINTSYSKTQFNKNDPLGYTNEFKAYNNELAVNSKFIYNRNSFVSMGINKQSSKDEINNRTIDSKGIYITNSNKFKAMIDGSTIFTQSLRVDSHSKFENETTGKVGIKHFHENIKGFTTSLNYGSSYKAPSLSQMWYNSTANLKPESIKSLDINLEYKNFKITIFDNKVKNLIEWTDPTPYDYSLVNNNGTPNDYSDDIDNNSYGDDYYTNSSGISTFKGYKLSYIKNIKEDTLFSFNYLNQTAKNNNDQDLQRRIQESANISVDYYGIEKMHLGFYANYIGERYDDLAKTKSTGNYTLINSVVNYEMDNKTNLYIKIDNLTDKLYQEVDGYGTLGRTITVGLNAKF